MKPKTMILLVVAVGCGLGASFMTSRYLAQQREKPAEEKMMVVVAKKRVPAYKPVKDPAGLFELKPFPKSAVPREALQDLEELKDKTVSREIAEGVPVTKADLLDPKGERIALKAGERATAIKVNAESLVGGFVFPGSRVDVVSTLRGGKGKAQTILQDKLVLAVGDVVSRDPNQPSLLAQTVTLACTPEEVQQLALAGAQGELRLSLRGMGDDKQIRLGATTSEDLGKGSIARGSVPAFPDLLEGGSGILPVPVPKTTPKPGAKPGEKPEPPPEPKVEAHVMNVLNGGQRVKAVFIKDPESGKWLDTDPENPDAWRRAIPRREKTAPKKVTPNAKSKEVSLDALLQ
jgi:pilus assembly protein CpaB